MTQDLPMKTDPEREEIAFGERVDWTDSRGGIVQFARGDWAHYGPMAATTARELIKNGYLDPEDRQNDAPTAETLTEFAASTNDDYPAVRAELIGYMVGPARDDARISIEGFVIETINDSFPEPLLVEIGERFDSADEKHVGAYIRYWWD